MRLLLPFFCFFFFNDTATTEIYTLSLHDALPISFRVDDFAVLHYGDRHTGNFPLLHSVSGKIIETLQLRGGSRSEEHTSELQSRLHLVCRLLLEKKKKQHRTTTTQCKNT